MDLDRMNSATAYPSIPTYHKMVKGKLEEEVTEFPDNVVLTEKVDGTNARIVLAPGGDYYIGSRKELLTAKGDRVANVSEGIVSALRDLADRLVRHDDVLTTFYLEVYGGKVGSNAKQYSTTGTVGYRLFDISMVELSVLEWERSQIAHWRDEEHGQNFLAEDQLWMVHKTMDVPIVPRLSALHSSNLPRTIEETPEFLTKYLPKSDVVLDDSGSGIPEGIVLRSPDRTVIAKARFEDYTRTLRKRK